MKSIRAVVFRGTACRGKEGQFMAKTLQLTFADRVGDALFIMLLRAGVKRGTMSLLTVHGRKRGSQKGPV